MTDQATHTHTPPNTAPAITSHAAHRDVEYFPRMTVYPRRFLCHESHFGEWTVNTITRDDGAVRMFEPLIMCPDRKAAESHAEHLISQEVAA